MSILGSLPLRNLCFDEGDEEEQITIQQSPLSMVLLFYCSPEGDNPPDV